MDALRSGGEDHEFYGATNQDVLTEIKRIWATSHQISAGAHGCVKKLLLDLPTVSRGSYIVKGQQIPGASPPLCAIRTIGESIEASPEILIGKWKEEVIINLEITKKIGEYVSKCKGGIITKEGTCYIIYEDLPGTNLQDFLSPRKSIITPIPLEKVYDILQKLVTCINQLHEICRIIHNDIYPQNIFITGERVVLIDFGNAIRLHPYKNVEDEVKYNGDTHRGINGVYRKLMQSYIESGVIQSSDKSIMINIMRLFQGEITRYESLHFSSSEAAPAVGKSALERLLNHYKKTHSLVKPSSPEAEFLAKGPFGRKSITTTRRKSRRTRF
jgi:serine/threonine protein kinase